MPPSAACPHADRVAAGLVGPAPLAPDLAAHLRGCAVCCGRVATAVLDRPPGDTTGSLAEWLTGTGEDPARRLTGFQAEAVARGRAADLDLGPYVLLDPLGAGGMGEVFRAWHRLLRRVDAVKRVRPEYAGDPRLVARFLREAEAAARLRHPNVVAVYTADRAAGGYYLAMEYVPGADLGRVVRDGGRLAPRVACHYARQAAVGLQHALDHGLVHRDVKPANLLLTADRRTVMVTDFGLARVVGPAGDGLTGTGGLLGTADYMAPEQADDARAADTRADLYALGCTLFFLLTGGPPFPGGTVREKLNRHAAEPPPPLPGVPPDVAAVVCRLLAKRPADRFQTPAELAAALAPLLARDHPPPTRPQPSPPPVAPPPAPPPFELPADEPPRPSRVPRATRPRQRWATMATVSAAAVAAVAGVLAATGAFSPRTAGPPAPVPPRVGPPGPVSPTDVPVVPPVGAAGAGWRLAATYPLGLKEKVVVVGFGPGGELVGASDEGFRAVWPAAGGTAKGGRLVPLRQWEKVRAVAPGGAFLVSDDFRRWDGRTGQIHPPLAAALPLPGAKPAAYLDAAAVTPDGRWLAGTVTLDWTEKPRPAAAALWDAAANRPVAAWALPPGVDAEAVAVTPDGGTVVAGSKKGRLFRWTRAGGRDEWAPAAGAVTAVAVSPDGRVVYSGHAASDDVFAWDPATGRVVRTFRLPGPPARLVASPDGRWLAAGAAGLVAWEPGRPDRPLLTLRDSDGGGVLDVAFAADSARVAACGHGASGAGEAWVWEPAPARE